MSKSKAEGSGHPSTDDEAGQSQKELECPVACEALNSADKNPGNQNKVIHFLREVHRRNFHGSSITGNGEGPVRKMARSWNHPIPSFPRT